MNTATNARAFVLDFFSRSRPIPGATEEDQFHCEYLRQGLLDSLKLVELITEIEQSLGIELQPEDFENPRFKTIGGLIEILEGKQNTAR